MLRQRRERLWGSVLGVAAGVAAVVSTGLASRAAVASMTADVEAIAGPARLEVTRAGGVDVADIQRLRPVSGSVRIAPVVEGTALAAESGELVRLLGVDGLGLAEELPFALAQQDDERRMERFARCEGLLLSGAAARALWVEPGETLELVVRSRRVALEVLALFEPARLASAWERTLVADVALAQELLGRLERVDRLELVPRFPLDDSELAARARALLPEGYRVGPASLRREEGERFVRALAFDLTALAGVSLLVAVVLVTTTLATSVVQRRAAIALLVSLGASRAQLALAVLLEAALIGLAGGLLGVALGALGARAIAADVHGSFATLSEDVLAGAVELEPAWIAAAVVLGLASALAAAYLPLDEAWRTPPVQNLRSEPREQSRVGARGRFALAALLGGAAWLCTRLPPWGGRPVWALVSALFLAALLIVLSGPLVDALARIRLPWLGTPLRLAQAALSAARRRAAWAASAVGVAVALAVSMTTMVGSFRASVVAWTRATMRADLHLRPLASREGATSGRIAPGAVEVARELFGRENVDPFHETEATVAGERVLLGGGELAVLAREGGVPFLDDRDSRAVFRAALEQGAALVNEPFARRFGVEAGEHIALSTHGCTVEREVAGVYRDFSGHTGRVVLDLSDYLALAADEGPESVGVFLPEGADVERERARLSSALAGRFELEILDQRQLFDEVMAVFERTFAVTVGLQGIASLVAALAIVLVLAALVRERERDLAVVRVVGGSRAQLGALVACQALLLGLAGTLGGLAIGLAIGYVLVAVVNVQSFGWSLDFTLPASVLWTAAAVVPACLAAGLVPAWLSLRLRPQEVLREPD